MKQGQSSGSSDQDVQSTTPLLKQRRSDLENYGASSQPTQYSAAEDDWDAEDNLSNPRNWAAWYKWLTVILVSFIELLTTMPNFMYAPNITDAQEDLGTSDDTLATFSLTIYILGFGLGPLLFAPLSEMYGRVLIYRSCLAAFLAMTVGCALSSNIGMLVAFRFLAGSFGAAPVAIGGAVVGDLFHVNERGTAMSIYQAGQIISAVIGPPVGGLIGAYMNWRWVFWIVCIMTAFALLCTLVVQRETHAPTLQRHMYESNDVNSQEKTSLIAELQRTLSRPLKLLTKSPVVGLSCILIFIIIGILNVFLTTMSRDYQQVYHMSSGKSSLVYIGLALGFVFASVLFGLTNDKVMNMLAKRNGDKIQPEFRLPSTIFALPIIVVGLLWYGWTIHFGVMWVLPIIGSGVAGFGITTVQLSITTYLVDSFDDFSASALAAITMARSIGGALVPLVGPLLYRQIGLGWGNSVYAIVTLACCPIPFLLYVYGSRWRTMFSSDDL